MALNRQFNLRSALVFMIALMAPIVVARAELGPDSWITIRAKSALDVDEGVRAATVSVDTLHGRVTLHGTVPSAKDKARAAEDVRQVPGVVQVRNILQVVEPGGRKRVRGSDDAIKAHAVRLSANRAGVRRVSSTIDAQNALDATTGAKNVAVPLEAVSIVQRRPVVADDEAIRRAVIRALNALDDLENQNIHVGVSHGIVWLSGTVPTWPGNSPRIETARSVIGVRSVVNGLRVVPLDSDQR